MDAIFMVLASLGYCYLIVKRIPIGMPRVISLLPVFYLFCVLPWYFSSPFARGIASFFITWITSFKLLLFSFDRGPLHPHKNSYIDFATVAMFPLKVKEGSEGPLTNGFPWVQTVARYELVPLCNQPYLATSLQDFWGRRWNRMSSSILKQTIYDPTRRSSIGIVGGGPARVVALIATLAVSGLMHELVLYFITCGMKPSWELTWFFVLHGLCMVLEVALNQYLAKLRGWSSPVQPALSIAFTLGFVMVTAYWMLFLPTWRGSQKECT